MPKTAQLAFWNWQFYLMHWNHKTQWNVGCSWRGQILFDGWKNKNILVNDCGKTLWIGLLEYMKQRLHETWRVHLQNLLVKLVRSIFLPDFQLFVKLLGKYKTKSSKTQAWNMLWQLLLKLFLLNFIYLTCDKESER